MSDGKCETCSAWSQLMARADSDGVRAVCLNPRSPQSAKWTHGRNSCDQWSDDPSLSDLP